MIYIEHLKKEIGTRTLFTVDKIVINQTDKIGLIGANGVGKTTLFKLLLGHDTDFSGTLVAQMELASLLHDGTQSNKNNGYQQMHDSPGEYQQRQLAQLLTNETAFLLVDEPTSHLDIQQKKALAKRFKKRKQGFMLISHDRDFIGQTCQMIFELTNETIEVYHGDYAFYLSERLKRQKFAQREYENYIAEKKRLTQVARDIQEQSAKVKTTPKRMGNSEARLHKMGGQTKKKKLDKRVKAVATRLQQLEVKEKPKEENPITLTMAEQDKIFAKRLVKADQMYVSYGDKVIFHRAKFEIPNHTKIALIGANGSGKTTLLKMILNNEVWVHPNLRMGYYSQQEETLQLSKSVLANVSDYAIYDQTIVRTVLARLGFCGEAVYKAVNILSEGEKAKVKLAKLMTADFNFLVLDEPTNFLDIVAVEAVEELFKGYDRPMLFVSHDRAFINAIADELLFIEHQQLRRFRGNLADYQQKEQCAKEQASDDEWLLEFRLTAILNQLASDLSDDERQALDAEYERLLAQKNGDDRLDITVQ